MTRSKRKGKRIIKNILQKTSYNISKNLSDNHNINLIYKKYELKYINSYFFSEPTLNNIDNNNLWEHTKERDCVFLIQPVGEVLFIHNGKSWIEFYITLDVVFHQFGKYAYTRKRCIYKNKKKKKKYKR